MLSWLFFSFRCLPPQVIEVRAKKRTGSNSLVTALRKTLEDHYPDKSLALGGTFIIQKGKAKIHIMVSIINSVAQNE